MWWLFQFQLYGVILTRANRINYISVGGKNNTEALVFRRIFQTLNWDYMEDVPPMNLEPAWLTVGETREELITPITHEDNEDYYPTASGQKSRFH